MSVNKITSAPTDNELIAKVNEIIDGKQDTLPSQAGNSGKFLTTNGTTMSWATAGGSTWTYDSTTETLEVS